MISLRTAKISFCRPRTAWLAGGLQLLFCAMALAQNYKFEHLSIEDGLSQGAVEYILQDGRGFIWFATRDGLNRFDGRKTKVFKHERDDSTSISNNFVRRILEDANGKLWLATQNGLNLFDPETERFRCFFHTPDDSTSLSSNNIMRVLQDGAGTIWVGTWGGGLNSLETGKKSFRRYARELHDKEFPRGNIINDILETRDSTLWVAALTGLFSKSPGQDRFVKHELRSPEYPDRRKNIVIDIYEDSENALWFGTYGGLLQFQPDRDETQRFLPTPEAPGNMQANQVRFIAEGIKPDTEELWLATANHGLAVFDRTSQTFTFYSRDESNPASLAHNSVWSITKDSGGTVWIGTDGRGISRLSPMSRRFTHVVARAPDQKQTDSFVWSMSEDVYGNLWVGTNSGVSLQNSVTKKWHSLSYRPDHEDSITEGAIYAIIRDKTGVMWLASNTGGLCRVRVNVPPEGDDLALSFKRYRAERGNPNSLSGDRLFSLFEDSHGYLWVGNIDEGVDRLDPARKEFTHFRPDQNDSGSISGSGIECIFEDHSGTLWFGASTEGLNRLDHDAGRFVHYRQERDNPNSMSNNHINHISEDAKGNLWIATGEGLNKLHPDRQTFTQYSEADGLPNSYVYCSLLDDDGMLWLSTNGGISRFDPKSEIFVNFSRKDGLQSNEFNAGAFYKSPRGEMFFGGQDGFNRFFPNDLARNDRTPAIVLTAFLRQDKPARLPHAIYATDEIRLSYRDYFFSFEFAALDYWAPEKNRYRYKMEGFDQDWVDAGTRNFVTFTNLDPGDYTLRVQGSNSDGVWNESGTAVRIIIAPPFWATWWFVGLIAATFAGLAYGAYRYRINRLLEMERLRTRISSDLHDEIATNLSSIAMFSSIIHDMFHGKLDTSGSDALKMLDRIKTLAEESVSSIRDIIWTINPKPETMHTLLIRLKDLIVPVCRAKKIALSFEHPGQELLPGENLPPEIRQHFWLLFKEAINNALKHSHCTRLKVQISITQRFMTCVIADNGKGFDLNASHGGNGLNTMRMRSQQIRGQLVIDSHPGHGTRIELRVSI